VLDDVEILLDNINAETIIISADHGEAFGEYGILGHKIGSLHPRVRRVPWVVTSAEDTHSYTPTVDRSEASAMSREELDQQLEALGYKT
jgi:glucan phosphoethanolaminetransferase (alkaline phosphatase superfamily)